MKIIKKIFLILTGCLLVLIFMMAGTYFYVQFKLKDLTPEVRAKLPGEFIQLEDGVISYYWKGPESGNIVVLVHGLSMPKFVWDGNIEALTNAGNRVLAYDHYGRGFSDRLHIIYDSDSVSGISGFNSIHHAPLSHV